MIENIRVLARAREQIGFLGYEFLTWFFLLLHQNDARGRVADLTAGIAAKGGISIDLGNRLGTCLLNSKEHKTTIINSFLQESHEAFLSIKNGHMIEILSLLITIDDRKASLSIHANDFAMGQIKLQQNHEREHGDDLNLDEGDRIKAEIFLRLAAIAEAESIIDRFFQHFLSLRNDNQKYLKSLGEMRSLIISRLNSHISSDQKATPIWI